MLTNLLNRILDRHGLTIPMPSSKYPLERGFSSSSGPPVCWLAYIDGAKTVTFALSCVCGVHLIHPDEQGKALHFHECNGTPWDVELDWYRARKAA